MEHLIMIRRFNGTDESAPICVMDPEFALRRARSLAVGNCGALVIDEAVDESGQSSIPLSWHALGPYPVVFQVAITTKDSSSTTTKSLDGGLGEEPSQLDASGRAENSMTYDPSNHLVTSSDFMVGIGLCMTLLACLAIF